MSVSVCVCAHVQLETCVQQFTRHHMLRAKTNLESQLALVMKFDRQTNVAGPMGELSQESRQQGATQVALVEDNKVKLKNCWWAKFHTGFN